MRGHDDFVDAVKWSRMVHDWRPPASTTRCESGIRATGEEAFVLRGNAGMFHDLSWNSNGARLAAACSDGQIWIWDARAGFAAFGSAGGALNASRPVRRKRFFEIDDPFARGIALVLV